MFCDASSCVVDEEIKIGLFEINGFKALGIEGMLVVFFQIQWDVIGWIFVNLFQLISTINKIVLALIPKVHNPETIKQFRPIILCTVLYRIFFKIRVSMLKPCRCRPYLMQFILRDAKRERQVSLPLRKTWERPINRRIRTLGIIPTMSFKKESMGGRIGICL